MSTTPTADALNTKLQALQPPYLELINESMNHAGYFDGKESHFKLTIVSDAFEGKRLVARHQLVYGLVNELINFARWTSACVSDSCLYSNGMARSKP